MTFKKRPIRQNHQAYPAPTTPPTSHSPSNNTARPLSKNTVNIVTLIAGIILIFGLFWITLGIIRSLDFSSLVFSFGKELKKDANRHTNFLLAGVGGAEHDGSNLTDTLIIASLDEQQKTVKMLSLPRDLYIDDKTTGGQRINKIYDTFLYEYDSSPKAMEKLGNLVTQVSGIPIDYTIKVNFDGFVKIVDALGGIDIDVENAIYDPYYPKGETIQYETFSIKAGPQHLDGDTALKFARSRKTTSDFDRAKRQQQILSAIKDQALSLDLLTDPGKLQNLYNSLADSIETNLSVAEIIELAKIAKDITRDNIESQVLTDDFTSCGGLLYTPVRDYFGGAAVLLPAGNDFEELQSFSNNYFNTNYDGKAEIQILNGTKTSGLALTYLNRLSRDCLNVTYYGNASDRAMEKTVIRYLPATTPEEEKRLSNTLAIIQQTLDAPLVDTIPPEYLEGEKRANAKIVIELGADYKKLTTPDPFDQLLYTTPVIKEEEPTTDLAPKKPLNSNKENSSNTTDSSATSATPPATTKTSTSNTTTPPPITATTLPPTPTSVPAPEITAPSTPVN